MTPTSILLTAVLAAGAAKDKPLLVVFSGDNGGEIEPCG